MLIETVAADQTKLPSRSAQPRSQIAGRVWFVSELYYPEETSTGYLLTRLAEGLAGNRSVSVLCGQPTYSARGVRASQREVRNGVEITRCSGTTFDKDRILGRVLNMLTVTLSLFLTAVRSISAGDKVIVVTNPPPLPYLVAAACWIRRAQYVLLVHDVYPDALYATGAVTQKSWAAKLLEPIAGIPYGLAVRIVVLGRDMRNLVVSKVGSTEKVAIIPNWADLDLVKPVSRTSNSIITALGLSDKWVVQYAGNMGRTHGIDTVVQAIKKLAEIDPGIQFLFVGSGAKAPLLRDVSQSYPSVTLLPPRPRSDQPNFLNACDVTLVSFARGMCGVSVPSRMYNILAAGKPIIAVTDDDSEIARVIREENVGWVVTPDDPDALVAAITLSRSAVSADPKFGIRARNAAEKYTLGNAISAYDDLLESVASH